MGRGIRTESGTLTVLRNRKTKESIDDLWGTPSPNNYSAMNTYLAKSGSEKRSLDVFERVKNQKVYSPETWVKALHGFEAKGFRIEVPRQMPFAEQFEQDDPNPKIHALGFLANFFLIYKDGKPVGDCNFNIVPDINEEPELRLGMIGLKGAKGFENPGDKEIDLSGNGFGKEFLEHLENVCRKQGIKRIGLHPVNQGSYVWARLGFELDPRDDQGYGYIRHKDYENLQEYKQASFDSIKNHIIKKVELSESENLEKEEIIEIIRTSEPESISDIIDLSKGYQIEGKDYNFIKEFFPGYAWAGVKLIK